MRYFIAMFRSIACTAIILSMSACVVSTITPPSPTVSAIPQGAAATITATAAGLNTATATSSTTASATPQPSMPTSASPELSAAPVITAQNAASLIAASLTLPDWPMRFLWIPAGVQIPGTNSPAPDFLAQTENGFYPIQLNPPKQDSLLKLNLPGTIFAFAPDLTSVITRSENGTLSITDLSGKELQKLDESAPYGAAYSPDGKFIAITTQNEMSVVIYDVSTGKRVTKLTGFQTAAPVYDAGILPGNSTIFWHARATLRFQDIPSGAMGKALEFKDFVNQMVFSADGTRMVAAVGQQLLLYKIPTGEPIAQINLSKSVNSLSLSPDDRLIAAGYGADIQFWDAATLAPVASLPGPNDFSGLVSFSPDGKSLISLHTGNVVNIWKAVP